MATGIDYSELGINIDGKCINARVQVNFANLDTPASTDHVAHGQRSNHLGIKIGRALGCPVYRTCCHRGQRLGRYGGVANGTDAARPYPWRHRARGPHDGSRPYAANTNLSTHERGLVLHIVLPGTWASRAGARTRCAGHATQDLPCGIWRSGAAPAGRRYAQSFRNGRA